MNQWFGHVVVGLLMDQCGRVEMFSIAKSLVRIANSLEELVRIQNTLLAVGRENIEWTKRTVSEIRENG